MNSEQITVTQALRELGLLDKRIEKTVQHLTVATVTEPSDDDKARDPAIFASRTKATYQSAQDLIRRRRAIKGALVQSNATTRVEIAGQTMTVAEAIERKQSIELDVQLLKRLKAGLGAAQVEYEQRWERAKQRLDAQAEALLGRENMKSNEYEALYRTFMEHNAPQLLDPLNAQAEIERLEAQIDTFRAQVDTVLDISNATTMLTINY